MIGTNKFLKVTLRKEDDFGDTRDLVGDVSDGVLLRPLEDLPLDQFKNEEIGDTSVKRGFNDAGLPAIPGLAQTVIPVKLRISGNTRTELGALTEDGMSKILDWAVGDRHSPGDDVVEADSTVKLIKLTAHNYVQDDVLLIGGIGALVVSTNVNDITIFPSLPEIPVAGVLVIGCESFIVNPDTEQDSVGIGVSKEGDAEFQWTAAGGCAQSISFDEFAAGMQPAINLEFRFAHQQSESGGVTHSATEIPNVAQVIGALGESRYTMQDPAGGTMVPVLASASVGLGIENELAEGINPLAVGGKIKAFCNPVEGETGTIRILQDDDEGTYEAANALIGLSFVHAIQLGSDLGKCFGIIYPDATYTGFPVASAQNNAKAVEFGFRSARGVLWRG